MKDQINWKWLISVAVVMMWTFSVITLYYVVHKPFAPTHAAALLSVLRDLFVAALVVYAGAGFGLHCLPGRQDSNLANGRPARSLERLVLSAALGLGFLGLIVFGVSLAGGLYRPVMWLLLAGGVILGQRALLRLIRNSWREGLELPSGRFYQFIAIFVTAMLMIALSQALLPPTAWDSLMYHLTGPKWYIEAHRFLPNADIVQLGYPELIEMCFTLGMSLAGPSVAQVIDWAFLLLTLLLLHTFARRYLAGNVGDYRKHHGFHDPESAPEQLHADTRTGWLAMAILLSAPTIVMLSFWAYIDIALMFYELSAVYAFLRWRETLDRQWLIAAGVFCGFGMSTKYTAISLIMALALLTTWSKRKMILTEGIRCILWLGLPATLITLPWLLKNWFFLSNPVYPFVFGGVNWDHFRQMVTARPGTGLAHTAPWQLLTAPWNMTIFGAEGKIGFQATIGPLYLIGMFILPFVWRRIAKPQRDILRPLLAICGVQYVLWLLGMAQSGPLIQTRLLLLAFPLLALLAASALAHVRTLRRPQFAVDWILNIAFTLVLGLNLLNAALDVVAINPLAYITGGESKASYLERRLDSYAIIMDYVNNNLPYDAYIYFLWEPRSFYCDRPCRPDPVPDAFPHLVYRLGNATAIADCLREAGYTHVLLYKTGLDFLLTTEDAHIGEKELAVLRELQANHLSVVYEEGGAYILYRLNETTDGHE